MDTEIEQKEMEIKKKEPTIDKHDTEFQNHTKWKKPDTTNDILYDSIYVKF